MVICLVIFVAMIILFFNRKIPMSFTSMGVIVALFVTGCVDADAVFAGFGNNNVLTMAGMFIVAYFVARALKISIWLGFGNCLTALYGFPFNAIITESMCKEMAATEDEREYLMAHMFPSMIVGGFSTVTITSVIIAGLFVNLF